ncbi:aspartate/methionine/tyrosine aminotransferase [Bradyrhizobium sp. i1.4.4]
MRYAPRIQQIAGKASKAWDIHSIAAEKRARGESAILLTVGDTDFASPASSVAAVHESLAAGRTYYTPSAGGRPMREAIARSHARKTGQVIDADQVVVTVGAQNALLTAALCLIEPGDQVLVPEPMYLTYPGTIAAAGGESIGISSPAQNSFHPLINEMEAAIGPRTRAIFLATPNNPTGAVYTAQELSSIAALCQKHDLWLVSDEVYGDLVYEGRHISPSVLPGMAERTITIGSLSKSHAMAGWRLGWMIGPPEIGALRRSTSPLLNLRHSCLSAGCGSSRAGAVSGRRPRAASRVCPSTRPALRSTGSSSPPIVSPAGGRDVRNARCARHRPVCL